MQHQIGSRYEATKALDAVALAKEIRAAVKQLVKSGELPRGKYSVRTRWSTHSRAIDISAVLESPVRVRSSLPCGEWPRTDANGQPISAPWLTREAYRVQQELEALHQAYNKVSTTGEPDDYSSVRFYGSVSVDGPEVDLPFAHLTNDLALPTVGQGGATVISITTRKALGK